MSSGGAFDDLKAESAAVGKDSKTRRILLILLALWLVTLAALIGVGWRAYFNERGKTETLAQQIDLACVNDDFGEGFSKEDQAALCDNAKKVLKAKGDIQEGEVQEPEIQDPEIQDPERQDPENQNDELQDAELQESENQEPEVDDPEIQDDEIQDDEIQDPEIDDPDPASPYDFTFVLTVPGPDGTSYIYTVTCNSGSGQCSVTGG